MLLFSPLFFIFKANSCHSFLRNYASAKLQTCGMIVVSKGSRLRLIALNLPLFIHFSFFLYFIYWKSVQKLIKLDSFNLLFIRICLIQITRKAVSWWIQKIIKLLSTKYLFPSDYSLPLSPRCLTKPVDMARRNMFTLQCKCFFQSMTDSWVLALI